uniref:Uncharacterized protein LOC102801806 n=1 Tax=Saccoglossus kowalevskii TaxID=10224 RepID=A0ABM0LWZ5_SACKO|nr:PREDICTED: uncharacterized protein LOC102801806 [Saccoglossus kowalevskii]
MPKVVHVTGTFYEVGYQIGVIFRERISNFFADLTLVQEILLPFSETEKGSEIYEDYLKAAKTVFPQYVQEMQGMSDATDVPFKQVFLLHISHELMLLGQGGPAILGCMNILVNYEEESGARQVLIGRNEDAPTVMKEHAYILEAEISEPDKPWRNENFTAYTYLGMIPGLCYGFNSHGLAFSATAVFPQNVLTGVTSPVHFVARKLLSSQTMQEAIDLLTESNAASGISVNIGTTNSNDVSKLPRIVNVEIAPKQDNHVCDCNIHKVDRSNIRENYFYYHLNMYKHVKLKHKADQSSMAGTERVSNLPVPTDIEGVLNILGDEDGTDFRIYKSYSGKDGCSTISTALFDLINCTLLIYLENPMVNRHPRITFSIPRKKDGT